MEDRTQNIKITAHELASDVIGIISTVVIDFSEIPGNEFLNDMNDEESVLFISTFLDRLTRTYRRQIDAINNKMVKSNERTNAM